MAGMIIGGGPADLVPTGFKSYLMFSGKIICFEEEKQGNDVFWKFPLILENVQDKQGQMQSFFRPLIPFGKDTKFKQLNPQQLICEVMDNNIHDAYNKTMQSIRAQLSGIEVTSELPS
jgi:hypothetical protein